MWSDFYAELVNRNIGVITVDEQDMLRNSCIAVAGCGGMGGYSAEQLVRLGVGHIKIADFDNFEVHNISRQAGSSFITVGQPKTLVLSSYFKQINPELHLESFPEGVQPENAAEFVRDADIVIDAIDYTCLYNSVVLHREARKQGLCLINPQAIAFGVSVLVFGPGTQTLEEYVGLPEGATREEIEKFIPPIEKFCPYFPSYIDKNIAMKAATGQINIPNIIMPQCLGTAIAVSEATMMILGRIPQPQGPNPRIFILDLQDRFFKCIE
ncbi:MAG TPA: ThiF family adenylyltransferase [Chryseolinea sp.]|nr:ThiF family adenylyltransferase [Chryseolinea sp.]HLC38940.1 ThiF family adenylyltransferase [Patescibacteria group bacterium]